MNNRALRTIQGLFFNILTNYIDVEEARKSIDDPFILKELESLESYLKDDIEKDFKLSRELDRQLWYDVVVQNSKIDSNPHLTANKVLEEFKEKY